MTEPLVELDGVTVEFVSSRGRLKALNDVSLTIMPGEVLGVVGESGSGKSVMGQAIMGLIRLPGRIGKGEIRWRGKAIVDSRSAAGARRLRGSEISMVFQDPMTSLNPLMTVGDQIGEMLTVHQGIGKAAAREEAGQLLARVGISAPFTRLDQFPFELSGGMRQRVMIAIAIACRPALVIADEPTTALDVTIQAQILNLLKELRIKHNLTLMMITHDLGVVAAVADRVAVIYAGRIVELAECGPLYARPAHPYTHALLGSSLRLDDDHHRLQSIVGSPPDLLALGEGCAFAPRCALATDRCRAETPPLQDVDAGRKAACWRPFEQADANEREALHA